MSFGEVDRVIQEHGGDESMLIGILMDVQKKYRYLSPENLKYISDRLNVPLSRVYGVATFYKAFSLKPRGEHEVHVCLGTACHLRGGPRIVEAFERELQVKAGDTSKDGKFTLETVNCLGACALAPLVRVDDDNHGKATLQNVKKIVKHYAEKAPRG